MRGVVVVQGVENRDTPDVLRDRIRQEEDRLRENFKGQEILANPGLHSWREAYRQTGIKPSKFRPSIESMIRRVLQGNQIPSINTLVDIGNLFSLKYLVPVGGHAIDVVHNEMTLRLATGEESFFAFGSDNEEHPEPNEIIFTDGNHVMTRRWTWRQAKHSLTMMSTTAIEFNVDALPPVVYSDVEKICSEIAKLVPEFCGGTAYYEILTRETPNLIVGRKA